MMFARKVVPMNELHAKTNTATYPMAQRNRKRVLVAAEINRVVRSTKYWIRRIL